MFQSQFPGAFLPCPRLEDVRELVGVERAETLAVLDGNVMVMSVPQTMTTFREYVQIVVAQIAPAIEAAGHVVVVFDEPKAMTRAKDAIDVQNALAQACDMRMRLRTLVDAHVGGRERCMRRRSVRCRRCPRYLPVRQSPARADSGAEPTYALTRLVAASIC